MNILLLGSGGRESAFAWKISQSSQCSQLFIAPGNGGTNAYGKNVNINPNNFEAVKALVLKENISLVVVGPEEPLVNGIHDFFIADEELAGIPVIGPKKEGAILEGSKDFSKQFMARHGIPTAASRSFTKETLEEGLVYLQSHALPVVLKADGLAAGKGVLILDNTAEAQEELKLMLSGKFGDAGTTVVIEEFLSGIELSVFVLTDGDNYVILPEAKDYKRIGQGDTGLNTGGMGSVSPVPFASKAFLAEIERDIIIPTINGLKKDQIDYTGFIFFGLIKVNEKPLVIEYNCRMGDPETESVIPRIENDLVDLFIAASKKKLKDYKLNISDKNAATVMIVAGGYPGEYEKGKTITGIENVRQSLVFHAGTALEGGVIKTNGGRVLAVSSLQDSQFEALQSATADAARIYFDGKYFREDIGFDLIS
ncbi:phosphoribosylamine--glycine ligase [Pedobacter heparinus]|uniref:Phosphoribosylamine--glycine ligase n=1 Tax=Pedobacter heparinus (strain ATCC 13125 / DSM 2366 / CIP 104194 / JCM 7457 / NBRC 12017 / NCIMB 9290 / NRRL B-14731 / HIM 762-3) TaxID=485917 RepID=C6XZ10_PEDHD|nr:phosphoribosylamine--glycine ligase [Pedobacter heparinus]ACU02492.1 phosphoribosylamine/glycine ligase [Pedobacter heparinus DSM 2366]